MDGPGAEDAPGVGIELFGVRDGDIVRIVAGDRPDEKIAQKRPVAARGRHRDCARRWAGGLASPLAFFRSSGRPWLSQLGSYWGEVVLRGGGKFPFLRVYVP